MAAFVVCGGLSSAHAATVSISAGMIVPGFGVTSSRATANLNRETFDNGPDGTCGVQSGLDYFGGDSQGDVRFENSESKDVRLRPDSDNNPNLNTNNASCYASIAYGKLDFPISPQNDFDYLGFYWGSPDPYNSIAFFDQTTGGNPISLGAFGTSVTGDQLTTLLGNVPFQSAYVEFDFAPDEVVRRIEVSSLTNSGFEFDNVVFHRRVQQVAAVAAVVPAPPSLTLLGLGAALVGAQRARRLQARAR